VDFYEVYEQHYDRVRAFILASVKNRWVTDDLVQETFLRVLQNLAKVRDPAKLSSWIFRIAANLCQDYFRSPSRKLIPIEDNPAGELPSEYSLENEIEKYQTSLLVQDLIKLLPEPMRQAIFLCDIKEENQQEAADLLGISLDNLKVRLHRARKQLKAIIEEFRFN
jgi:RNA polymerase sigma-70 factor (ECF subfamily)